VLDDLHFSLECDALGAAITLIHGRKVANGATKCPSVWTENNIHGSPGGLFGKNSFSDRHFFSNITTNIHEITVKKCIN